MIMVDDILALPAFEEITPVCDYDGAGKRVVKGVGIIDCSPEIDNYAPFESGEFILTTLGFAAGNAELAEQSLLAMIARNFSAIAVKTVYGISVSDGVKEASKLAGVPVYEYSGAFHEKVAYQALDLIRRDKEDLDKGRAIDELLQTHDGSTVRKRLYHIAGVTGATLRCIAVLPAQNDALTFYATLDLIAESFNTLSDEHPEIECISVCHYHDVILVFVSMGKTTDSSTAVINGRCEALLATIGNIYCGASQIVELSDGDMAIRQALSAMDVAEDRTLNMVEWEHLQTHAFADAVRNDRMFMNASSMYQDLFTKYDRDHGSELYLTAENLVREHGDIRMVAQLMHQHPNTIRYRLRKMKAIAGASEESDRMFLLLLDLVFLPTMDVSTRSFERAKRLGA